MSLQVLLAEYPNYSARKIRKLARDLQFLNNINSKEAKSIAADLLDYHLQSAKLEMGLNDDISQEEKDNNIPNRFVIKGGEPSKFEKEAYPKKLAEIGNG